MSASKTQTSIALLSGVIVLLLIVTTVFSLFTVNRLRSNLDIQVHTSSVITDLKDNLIFLVDAETGERGFIITADTNYLEPYNLALQNIQRSMKQLRTLTKDDPMQQKSVDTLEHLITNKLQRISALISLKKQGDEKTINQILSNTNEGKKIMDNIRFVNQSMQDEELKLFADRKTNTNLSIENAKIIFILEGIFSLLITLSLTVIIFRELERRTKAEKESAISSERFSKIFNENPVAMTLSEIGTNKIHFANNVFCKSFGYNKEEVIGHTSQELKLTSPEEEARLLPILLAYLNETRSVAELQALPPEENEKLVMKLKQAMGDINLEVLYNRKNGETFYAILSYDLIKVDNKKFTITSYLDISEQKKAENKIIAYSIELERKNKEIEQFAYIASHDLQEPLRTVSNFSQLLAQKIEAYSDKEASEYMGYISSGAKRMSNLIFDLLEYSRIGRDTSKVLIDCNILVGELLTDMAVSIEESRAKIHVDRLPVLNAFIELRSLFQNLLSNAIKFRKGGMDPVITISAKDKGREFVFSIKDNGIGIEETYYERIFLIFQRLHTRAEYEGTGIGLSQCKKIVELHGGKIWVESKLGNGSTFYFTIPKTEKNNL